LESGWNWLVLEGSSKERFDKRWSHTVIVHGSNRISGGGRIVWLDPELANQNKGGGAMGGQGREG